MGAGQFETGPGCLFLLGQALCVGVQATLPHLMKTKHLFLLGSGGVCQGGEKGGWLECPPYYHDSVPGGRRRDLLTVLPASFPISHLERVGFR